MNTAHIHLLKFCANVNSADLVFAFEFDFAFGVKGKPLAQRLLIEDEKRVLRIVELSL
jgi:hypothetical protein